MNLKSESETTYAVDQLIKTDEDELIRRALDVLRSRFARGAQITSPSACSDWLMLEFNNALHDHEEFAMLSLTTDHKIIGLDVLSIGTIDGASVHTREVLKTALKRNAAAVMFVHNHPSGRAIPSQADLTITARQKTALDMIGIRVLDHFILGETTYSFAEHGTL